MSERLTPGGVTGNRPGPNPYYADARVSVSNENLVTVRDAMRGLNRMVEQLQRGEVDKFVLMHHGRMVAAIVPLSQVEGLMS